VRYPDPPSSSTSHSNFFYQIAVPFALLFLVLRIVWPRVVKFVGLTDLDKILALVAGEPVERLNPSTDGHYRYRN
jgi:hypothetical protein